MKHITITIEERDGDNIVRTKTLDVVEVVGSDPRRFRVTNGEVATAAEFVRPGRVPPGRYLIEMAERALGAVMVKHKNKGVK